MILGGDFNAPLELPGTTEIEPLLAAGFVLAKTPDGRWTHRYKEDGGQFDGFFTRDMGSRAGQLDVPKWPESKHDFWFYRDLSDHLPAFLLVDTTVTEPASPSAPDGNDPQPVTNDS